jgi:isoleucyl-tRNA synthetase
MAGRPQSVHIATFPCSSEILSDGIDVQDEHQQNDWATLRGVRDEILKALEEARNQKMIGTGLEAQVLLSAPEPLYSLLKRYEGFLRYLFIVSQVTLVQIAGNGATGVHVEVKKADGAKCDRCWNYSIHVGENKNYPTICERCSEVLKELEPA